MVLNLQIRDLDGPEQRKLVSKPAKKINFAIIYQIINTKNFNNTYTALWN